MARPERAKPRDVVPGWPDARSDDPVGEVARQFTLRLRAAIGDRSLRDAGTITGTSHVTLLKILDGQVWPDMATIAKLELGLGVDLWPGRRK